MECWSKIKQAITLASILALCTGNGCSEQYTSYGRGNTHSGTITILATDTLSANTNDSNGIVPIKKQLENCATGFSGGVLQPAGFPVGQLYCTAANKASGEGAGGPVQGFTTATSSGTGIVAITNGHGAGGIDSSVTMTDTYGANIDDAICTGDPNNNFATPYAGLSSAPCVANSSATFAESTATSLGNADVLYPAIYVSNSTALDGALYDYLDQYFCIDNLSTLHDFEFDTNINSSPTAYGAGNGAYFGWGFHWNTNVQMFQYCPQNCSAWVSVKGVDITGAHPNLTTYAFTNGHCYRTRNYNHRLSTCSFTSSSNCAFYDYFTVYDVTAGATPITYALLDVNTNLTPGFIPVDNHTFASGVYDQVQLDMTTGNASTQVRVISHTLTFFSIN